MGFFNDLGKFTGKVAGTVIGGPIQIIGEFTGVDLIEDIGRGVRKASEFAGGTAGSFTDGAVGTVAGIIQEDTSKRNEGLSNMTNAIGTTAKGVYYTAKTTLKNGADVIGGAIDGDMDMVKNGAMGIIKTVAVGALAIGVVDFIDGADGIGADTDLADADGADSYPGSHHVDPQHVNGYVRSDGTVVSDYWRDGDGDSSTHLTAEQGGGYIRTNPDGVVTNNIG